MFRPGVVDVNGGPLATSFSRLQNARARDETRFFCCLKTKFTLLSILTRCWIAAEERNKTHPGLDCVKLDRRNDRPKIES